MPPKPRPRKISTTKDVASEPSNLAKETKAHIKDAEMLMPPPPDPLPPQGILEPEMNAMSGCLRNAVVKTGQIYEFYADTRRLNIQRHATEPPRSLTASLGREVEKFDRLCDAMESHLLRAITVLQRDLDRERRKAQDSEKAAVASRTRSKSLSMSPTSIRTPLPGPLILGSETQMSEINSAEASSSNVQSSPPQGPPGRRGSTISLSSLHRPAFPHKLDLSSTTLRISAEEASLFTAGPLASPVTLAPKSARPTTGNEIQHDFMAAFEAAADANANNQSVDIDLTVPDTDAVGGNVSGDVNMEMTLGSSADKPIELDLDNMDIDISTMSDLFGDVSEDGTSENVETGLFDTASADKQDKQEDSKMALFDAPSAAATTDGHNDLFASFSLVGGPQSSTNPSNTLSEGLMAPIGSLAAADNNPSPTAIIASFTDQMNSGDPGSSADLTSLPDDFNLDLLGDFANNPTSAEDMAGIEEMLNLGGFGATG